MKQKKTSKSTGKIVKHVNKKLLFKTFGLLLGLELVVAFGLFLIWQYNSTYPATGEAKSTLTRAWCNDSDNRKDYLTKGIVKSNIYPQGKEDYCYTFNTTGKAYLMEGFCKNNKYVYVQKGCGEINPDFGCSAGVCKEQDFVKIYGDGKPEHLDIIFVPYNFPEEDIIKNIPGKIKLLLWGNDNGSLLSTKTGFLEIPSIEKNANKINVYLVKIDAFTICGKNCSNSDFSAIATQYVPSFDNTTDLYVIYDNEEFQMAFWLAGEVMGLFAPINIDAKTFAHEFGHAFAKLNEEYFIYGKSWHKDNPGEIIDSPNCDFNPKPQKWCAGVDEQKYQKFKEVTDLNYLCYDIIINENETAWYDICPKLNISGFWSKLNSSGFWKKVEKQKFCGNFSLLLNYSLKFQTCNNGIMPQIKYVNLGVGCPEGLGYYPGCHGSTDVFRSTPFGIMGSGNIGEQASIYGSEDVSKGKIYTTPLYPEAVPEYSLPAQEELTKRFSTYS